MEFWGQGEGSEARQREPERGKRSDQGEGESGGRERQGRERGDRRLSGGRGEELSGQGQGKPKRKIS